MIYKDNQLSYELGTDIFRYKYDTEVEEILHISFTTCDAYEMNEFMLCKQKDKYYVLGASPNTNYIGFLINEDDVNIIKKNENELKNIYIKYEIRAFG